MKWILTQNGKSIVNIDNCNVVKIEKEHMSPESDIAIHILYIYTCETHEMLGRYCTEEQAVSAMMKIRNSDYYLFHQSGQIPPCECSDCRKERG